MGKIDKEKAREVDDTIYDLLVNCSVNGKAKISNKSIASQCDVTESTVYGSILRLIKHGSIDVKKDTVRGIYRNGCVRLTNIYTLKGRK